MLTLPRRRTLTAVRKPALIGLVAVLLAPAAGAAATPGELLARHRPVLVLHPLEQFRPIAVEPFVAASDVEVPLPGEEWQSQGAAAIDALPGSPRTRSDVRGCDALLGLIASTCYTAIASAEPVAYGAVRVLRPRIVLQYWFFYAYNPWSAEPSVATPRIWWVHEGDWEQVTLVLDRRGRPLEAGYSQHCGGERRPWREVAKWRRTSRPLVYVGLGSHANYFTRGAHRHERRCWPDVALSIFEGSRLYPTDYTARGEVLTPALKRVTATAPSWMAFPGAWGETARFGTPGGTILPFGLGPEGPAFHRSWRDPLGELRRYRTRR